MRENEFANIERMVGNVKLSYALTDGMTFYKKVPTSTLERLALRLALKEQFGDILENETLAKMENEYLEFKAKLEKEKAERERAEREKWLEQQREPFNWLLKILRNDWHIHAPQQLDEWIKETSIEERKTTLEKFQKLAKARGLPLPKETIEFGLNFLLNSINIPEKTTKEGISWFSKILK